MRSFSSRSPQFAVIFCAITMISCGGTPQSYVEKGNKYTESGKYADAQLQYEKAIQKDSKYGDAHYRLALLDLKRNQPVPAYRELQRASELMPGNQEVLSRLGQLALSIYNADPKHPQQLYDQAAKVDAQLISKNPDGFDGNLLKGAIALADRKPADAVLSLRKAATVKPDDADAQLGLARALVQNNQIADGISLVQGLIAKNKAFGPAYDFLFEEYQSAGKKDDAENVLKLKVANNPKQAPFILELARYYATQQKPPEVDATIAKLTGNTRTSPTARSWLETSMCPWVSRISH